ncbi:MAG: MFS transporter [Chloroflexi bacterium]|nr:MFS transporter [Chloroflexota bacterium]
MTTQTKFVSRLGKSFAALQARDFRYLVFSSAALGFGQWFQQIGLGWLVFQETGSATQMGAIGAVRGVVFLMLSPPAGILCDRMSRRLLIIGSTGVTVLQALGLAVLVGTGRAELWHLYLFSVIEGAASSVNQPARQAFVYDVVEKQDLASAVTLNSIAQNIARVSGPAIAGIIIGFVGTASVFYILTALKVAAIALTVLISSNTRQVFLAAQENPLRSLAVGLRYSWENKAILGLVVIGVIPTLFIYPYVQFLPFFAARLGSEEQAAALYGFLATGVGWGSLVGLSGLVVMGDLRAKGKVMLVAQTLYPVAVALFALSNSFMLAMAFLMAAGVFNSINTTLQNTLFLLLSREDVRGRVMSLHSMIGGLQPIGSLTMGVAIGLWGASGAVVGFMAVSVACILIAAAAFGQMRRA